MTDEILEKSNQIKSDLKAIDEITLPIELSKELFREFKEFADKQKKRLEKEFKRLNDIDEFIRYCYVKSIDFNYTASSEELGELFCAEVREKYEKYQKEVNDKLSSNDHEMTIEEMKTYLMSTGLYENTDVDMFYENRMMKTDKTIPIKELVERVVEIDKEYDNEPWNIRQILTNIDIIVPLEDRK